MLECSHTPDTRGTRQLWARIRRAAAELGAEADWAKQLKGKAWPSHETLEGTEASLHREATSAQAREQLGRVQKWETRLREDWKTRRGATYKWVRDDFHPRAAFMKLENGTLTGNVSAMRDEAQRVLSLIHI